MNDFIIYERKTKLFINWLRIGSAITFLAITILLYKQELNYAILFSIVFLATLLIPITKILINYTEVEVRKLLFCGLIIKKYVINKSNVLSISLEEEELEMEDQPNVTTDFARIRFLNTDKKELWLDVRLRDEEYKLIKETLKI